MSGKGSAPRPFSVDAQTFAQRWAQTFGRKDSPDLIEADNGNGSEPDPEGQGQAEGIA